MKRIFINGSFEPLWRKNARDDADTIKAELFRSPVSRRMFVAGSAALLGEYLAQRRAVAFPFPHGAAQPGGVVTGITNARTGTQYQWLPSALMAMQAGDTILLPAGPTYQYLGTTYYYANHSNSDCDASGCRSGSGYGVMYLGKTPPYAGITGGDYGTIQAVGTANNGRALITPTYGALAADFHPTHTEMFFDLSTPVSNFSSNSPAALTPFQSVVRVGLADPFRNFGFTYTGINLGNNSLTGIVTNADQIVPTGRLITSYLINQNKGLFVTAGQNPGWTFNNLELAYACYSASDICCGIQQQSSNPGGPYVGSMALTNCYVHDCNLGLGIGYAGIGAAGDTFTHLFDTEIYQCGMTGQTHNIYIGHIGEFIMDNCYSHQTTGAWLVKTRAALNVLTYNQIRGERTAPNPDPGSYDASGTDIPSGGLTYFIGNVLEQSRSPGNPATINYMAEGVFTGSMEGGAANPLQEVYAINNTFVGMDTGSSVAPVTLYALGVHPPPTELLGQTNGGSLPARQYWASSTSVAVAGETNGTTLAVPIGGAPVYQALNVSANKLLTSASAETVTGATGWNFYANYGDPLLYAPFPLNSTGNSFFWDAGLTQPVFDFTSGGSTVSVVGTLTSGSNVITSITSLSGMASIAQLQDMPVYIGGIYSGFAAYNIDTSAATITMAGFGTYSGSSGPATITFGLWLWCGITYQTAFGDSVNVSADAGPYTNSSEPVSNFWYDGSYGTNTPKLVIRPYIQVDPGQKLIVNAPPTGPSWATGVNVWLTAHLPNSIDPTGLGDAGLMSYTKQTSSPIAFGGSWTSPATVLAPKADTLQPILFLQNASPIPFGTGFTEPTSGLVNNLNPTRNKLQWYRRAAINAVGPTQDCWYAVVPFGGLSSYSDTIHLCSYKVFNTAGTTSSLAGCVSVWRGCATDPFDANFRIPLSSLKNAETISTAAGNVVVLAGFRSNSGTVGTGFTSLSTADLMNAQYKSSVPALTNLDVTETGGFPGDNLIVDVLAGTSAPPTLISTVSIGGTGQAINFTIPSANEGDILYLIAGQDSIANIACVGKLPGTPIISTVGTTAPVIVVQNCLSANYNPSTTGGLTCLGDFQTTVPVGYVTAATNLQANPYNGSSFGAPTWATVFADSVQTDFDYRLAVASPAKNAASNPGSVHSQDLIPHYQINWHGSPTLGTPIPAKAARTDIGPALTGSIGALT